MGCLEVSGVPVLYIGLTVTKDEATGPLGTAFSSARHLQRRFTSSDMRDIC
jgi:hypothetical protein